MARWEKPPVLTASKWRRQQQGILVLTSLDRLLFKIENIIYLGYKTSYLNEEFNCTEPSPSIGVPWQQLSLKQCLWAPYRATFTTITFLRNLRNGLNSIEFLSLAILSSLVKCDTSLLGPLVSG
jgi:hypothetical protein